MNDLGFDARGFGVLFADFCRLLRGLDDEEDNGLRLRDDLFAFCFFLVPHGWRVCSGKSKSMGGLNRSFSKLRRRHRYPDSGGATGIQSWIALLTFTHTSVRQKNIYSYIEFRVHLS